MYGILNETERAHERVPFRHVYVHKHDALMLNKEEEQEV